MMNLKFIVFFLNNKIHVNIFEIMNLKSIYPKTILNFNNFPSKFGIETTARHVHKN